MVKLDLENDTLRTQTLEAAKKHKASWIELGQFLFTVHKDKHYKSWGYLTFETYCRKELSIKDTTASKLIKSYDYLEKEEPRIIQEHHDNEAEARSLPNYESVNLLRLAKQNQKLTPADMADIRKSVLSEGREPKEVRAQVKKLLSERDEKDPREVRRDRRNAAIKRMITVLSTARRELDSENLIPDYLSKQISELMAKLEDQLEGASN